MDDGTKATVQKIPLLSIRAGPRDGEAWNARLKEELTALIKYVQINKNSDKDWFQVESNKTGLRWSGKCWYFHDKVRNGTSKSVHYLELTRFTFLNPMIRSATSLIWSLRFR
mmetsp:Transcript_16635/g.34125  ORF Transcript_16635/g.34125 Transcript_16635/m.34125 type:complete len:112 (-) Transcript_16635:383-718(-)